MKSKKIISVICLLAMIFTTLVVPYVEAAETMTDTGSATLATVPTGDDLLLYDEVDINVAIMNRGGWNSSTKTPQSTVTGDYIFTFDTPAKNGWASPQANSLVLHFNGVWFALRMQYGDILVKEGAYNVEPYANAPTASSTTSYTYPSFDLVQNGPAGKSWKVCVKKTGTTLDFYIKETSDEDGNPSAANWFKISKTVAANSPMNLQAFRYNYPDQYQINNEMFYTKKPAHSASISGVQPTRAGSKIEIALTPEFASADTTTVPAVAGGTVAVTQGVTPVGDFAAAGSVTEGTRKLTLTIPTNLVPDTTYTVDLSNVTVFGLALTTPTVTFTTNNGEVEDAYAQLNALTTSSSDLDAAVTILEGFNSFVQSATLDVFADSFVAGNAARKKELAKKIIEGKPAGGYAQFDYSDLTAVITSSLLEMKIASYDGVGDEEDPLGIFVDPIYASADIMNTAGGYIKELAEENGCQTLAKLQEYELKARSVMTLSAATNASDYIAALENGALDFDGIIDTTNPDWVGNKVAVAEYAKIFKPGTTPCEYTSLEEANQVFEKSIGLVLVKALDNIARGDITSVLNKYNDAMGLDLSSYYAAGPDAVNLEIYKSLNTIPLTDQAIVRLQGLINSAAAPIIAENDANPVVPPTIQEQPTILTPIIAVPFIDLAGYAWASEKINTLRNYGIISGTSQTTYDPGKAVTRAELATMIVKAFELNVKTGVDFADVKITDWFYDSVNVAYSAGIVAGSNGKFRPNDSVTRQDMAVMIDKALANYNIYEGEIRTFADTSSISNYAKSSVLRLTRANIINGSDGKFLPMNALTRAEAAVVIYQVLTAIDLL